MHAPMDIYMHKVAASNLFLWADVSGKLKQKCLLEFLNKFRRDFSYKWYFECKKDLDQKLLFFSNFFVIATSFTTGGIHTEVENS